MRITKKRKIVVLVVAIFLIFVIVGTLLLYDAVHKVEFDIEVVRGVTLSDFEIGIKIINPTIFPIRVSSDFSIFVEGEFGAFATFEGIDVGPNSDRVVFISVELEPDVIPLMRYAWIEFGNIRMKIWGWAHYSIASVLFEEERIVEIQS